MMASMELFHVSETSSMNLTLYLSQPIYTVILSMLCDTINRLSLCAYIWRGLVFLLQFVCMQKSQETCAQELSIIHWLFMQLDGPLHKKSMNVLKHKWLPGYKFSTFS